MYEMAVSSILFITSVHQDELTGRRKLKDLDTV